MKFPRLILLALLVLATVAHAQTSVSTLFADHMVIQRDQPVEIWGWDSPDQKVTLSMGNLSASAITNAEGMWRATLPPQPANKEPQDITITGASTVLLENILVGEVWVLFGRSNVGFPLRRAVNGDDAVSKADHPLVRFTQVFDKPSLEPHKDLKTRGWKPITPNTAKSLSAVGYYFACALQRDTDVPVGLVQSNWGGSPGYMWIERSIYEKAFPPGSKEKNLEWLEEFEADSHAYHKSGEGAREYSDKRKNERIGALYHPFVEPILGLSVRGVIFYCSGTSAEETEIVATTWRSAWGNETLPFLYVQIPPGGGPKDGKQPWGDPNFNGAFDALDRSGRIGNSSMIVTLDTGEKSGKKDIHPPIKEPVGERLALAARGLAMGEDVIYRGPRVKDVSLNHGEFTITFTDVGSGLVAEGGALEGFAISSDGKSWEWAKSAEISGDQVIVTSALGDPKYVRYGVFGHPTGNLYNKEGLPASVFSTAVSYPE